MSRMYSVLNGSPSPRPAAAPEPVEAPAAVAPWAAPVDDDFPAASPEAPYVEVGGPGGPVFSAGSSAVKAAPVAVAAESAPAPRTYPRLADTPAYLSVTFHDISGRPRPKTEVEGPDPGLVALHFPDHPVSGEYRTLRDEVRAQLPAAAPRVLLFTAAAGEAGTTTVLLNLAVTLAREDGPRVLVVDANGTTGRPTGGAAAKLGLKPAPGLAEVLAQQVPLAWAVQTTAVPNLQLLPAGITTSGDAADLPKLLGQLRQWYDWVLVDGGVWGSAPDRDASCPAADAVYLVTRSTDVDRSEFAGLRGWVRELGGLLRGYVTTRA